MLVLVQVNRAARLQQILVNDGKSTRVLGGAKQLLHDHVVIVDKFLKSCDGLSLALNLVQLFLLLT